MGKFSKKKIVTIIVIIVVVLLFIFSLTNIRSTNKVDNSALTASALRSLSGEDDVSSLDLISKTLRFGNRGGEVELLQNFLNEKGYDLGRVDGVFGLKTRRSLKQYQEDNGQRPTGILNEETLNFINQTIIDESTKIDEEIPVEGNPVLDDGTGSLDKTAQEEEARRNQENEKLQAEAKKQEEINKQKEEERINQEKLDAENKKQEEIKKQKQEEEKNKKETIELITKKNEKALFADYSCKANNSEKLTIFTGETIDETKNYLYHLSDIWSTTDGVSWEQEAKSTNIGEGWERMTVRLGDTVYSFGGKYLSDNSGKSDNGIYKSTNGTDWDKVGDLPEMSHYYDRSVVYYKDAFWLIGSEEGKNGVWTSSTGEKWTQILTTTPWDGLGVDSDSNNKGKYDSNSLGAYVIKDKMWYIVYNNQDPVAFSKANPNTKYAPEMTIYSTSNGKDWKNEGYLMNSQDSSSFDIKSNINPQPLYFKDKVWVISTNRTTGSPLVISTDNGKDWIKESNSSTQMVGDKYYSVVRRYPSTAVFLNKLWSIGGWDIKGNSKDNDNGNDVFSSSDGVKWEQVKPKGVSFPAIGDRWLAGVATFGSSSPKAANLEIQREYNITSFLTGEAQKDVILGKWNLIANSNKDKNNTGSITINSFSFLGTDYKSSTGKEFSTLENLENVTVYINDTKVSSIKKINGPFYDKSGEYALPQTFTFDPITIKNGENVWIKLTADFTAPNFKNIEIRTWLSGVGFVDSYSTPCSVYSEDLNDGIYKFPGRNLYYKDR